MKFPCDVDIVSQVTTCDNKVCNQYSKGKRVITFILIAHFYIGEGLQYNIASQKIFCSFVLLSKNSFFSGLFT